jgi:hypothetical protein
MGATNVAGLSVRCSRCNAEPGMRCLRSMQKTTTITYPGTALMRSNVSHWARIQLEKRDRG